VQFVLPINYRLPETLPTNQRDFPPRDAVADHHEQDSGFLLLMVAGYLLMLFGFIALLATFAPDSNSTIVAVGGSKTCHLGSLRSVYVGTNHEQFSSTCPEGAYIRQNTTN
jgi:hypothetical protein